MQMPWTTVEALVERGEVPWEGQDSGWKKMGSLCVIHTALVLTLIPNID